MISTKEIKIRNRQELHPQGLKMCHRCHQVKPRTDEFFTVACRTNHPWRDRHKGYCKECDKKRRRLQKLALKKDPERHLRRLIASLKSRAKAQSLPFNLIGDDLVIQYHQQNGNASLTEDDIKQIRQLAQKGISTKELCQRFNQSRTNIKDIKASRVWKHVN